MEDNHQITLTEWMEMKEAIRRELNNVKHAFVRVGYYLRRAEDEKLYLQDGYASLAEFAQKEYGLGATTVSRFMSINRKYSVDGYSPQLLPEYQDYKQSVLIEMLTLPDSDLQMITPDTPRETVRELNRFNRQDPGGEDQDIMQAVRSFFRDNKDLVRELTGEEADSLREKEIMEIINPGGNRTYRKGLYFISMTEKCVSIKKFGNPPETWAYEEFLQSAAGVLNELKEEMDEALGEGDAQENNGTRGTGEPIADGGAGKPGEERPNDGEKSKEENRGEEADPQKAGEQSTAEENTGIRTDDQRAEETVVGDNGQNHGAEPEPECGQDDNGESDQDDYENRTKSEETGERSQGGKTPVAPAQSGAAENIQESGNQELNDAGDRTRDEETPIAPAQFEPSENIQASGKEELHPADGAGETDEENRDPEAPETEPLTEETTAKEHVLRIKPEFFSAVSEGKKTFELRRDDRNYEVGDQLLLQEFDDGRFTGRILKKRITWKLSDFEGLAEGYCILAIR